MSFAPAVIPKEAKESFIYYICVSLFATNRYKCANYGDQGISVNCSDIYKHNIDCQWVDISELEPGEYVLKVSANNNSL